MERAVGAPAGRADMSNLERPIMKTRLTTTVRLAGWAVALALLAGPTTKGVAQEKGSARGGATLLLKLTRPKAAPKAGAAAPRAMACANCSDRLVRVPDPEPKGAGAKALLAGGPPTKLVARHQCAGCTTQWVVKGHGKAKTSQPVHQCPACL